MVPARIFKLNKLCAAPVVGIIKVVCSTQRKL